MNDNGRMWDEYDKALNKIEAQDEDIARYLERIEELTEQSNKIYAELKLAEAAVEELQASLFRVSEMEIMYRERCAELELRLDIGTGNMYDVVVMENERLRARVAELVEQCNTINDELRLNKSERDALIMAVQVADSKRIEAEGREYELLGNLNQSIYTNSVQRSQMKTINDESDMWKRDAYRLADALRLEQNPGYTCLALQMHDGLVGNGENDWSSAKNTLARLPIVPPAETDTDGE